MNLLLDPRLIYNDDPRLVWDDSMAYLNDNEVCNSNLKDLSHNKKKSIALLKCGFLRTGCPKKIWVLNIQGASIEVDHLNNKWYQIESDMLLTSYDDLTKFRTTVQKALQYGIHRYVDQSTSMVTETKNVITTNCLNKSNNNRKDMNVNDSDVVMCCAGEQCGLSKSQSNFILISKIKHRCIVCLKAMHGGVCGAEACTVLKESECGPNAVICFPCIDKECMKEG